MSGISTALRRVFPSPLKVVGLLVGDAIFLLIGAMVYAIVTRASASRLGWMFFVVVVSVVVFAIVSGLDDSRTTGHGQNKAVDDV